MLSVAVGSADPAATHVFGARVFSAPKRRPAVKQVILMATHTVEAVEQRMLSHYHTQLAATINAGLKKPVAELWLLLYSRKDSRGGAYFDAAASGAAQTQVAVWGDRARDRAFPRASRALATHWGYRVQKDVHLKTYFYQHTGLYLWLREFRSAYRNLRFLWRMEPDVMLTGPLGQLLSLSARDQASDLLLPRLTGRNITPYYGCTKKRYRPHEAWGAYPPEPDPAHPHVMCTTHWVANTPLLNMTRPGAGPVFALVPVGRYSIRFINETMRTVRAATFRSLFFCCLQSSLQNCTAVQIKAYTRRMHRRTVSPLPALAFPRHQFPPSMTT